MGRGVTKARWGVFDNEPGYVVVMPIDDKRAHDELSKDCECMPEVEVIGASLLIIHTAFDFRHVAEWLNDPSQRSS